MFGSIKQRLARGSKLLTALGFSLVLCSQAVQAQSTITQLKTINVVPPTSSEYINFDIEVGKAEVNVAVETPVEGLISFEVDEKTHTGIEVKFFDQNGDLLGIDGVRISRPGKVRARISRHDRYDTDKHLRFAGRFILFEDDPDIFEPNDTPDLARVLKLGPENPVAGGPAMFFPKGDVDWFRLEVTAPGEITPYVFKPAGSTSSARLQDGVGNYFNIGYPIRVKPGIIDYKFSGFMNDMELHEFGFTFEPIWDDCQSNIQIENACALEIGKPLNLTLRPRPYMWDAKNRSAEKWFSVSPTEPGYIVLSLTGLPKPKYDDENVLTSGLKLGVTVLFSEFEKSNYIAARISNNSIVFHAEKQGTYKIGLRGDWLNADPQRTIKLTPLFRKHITTSIQSTDLAFISMALDDPSGDIALGMTLLADIAGGYYTQAQTPEKIKSVMKEFIGGIDPKQSRTPTSNAAPNIVILKPETTPSPTPVLTAGQIELARLEGLRTYLEADKDIFLFRHHFRTPSGEILKRLDKTNLPGKVTATHVHTKTEKLSPVISRRLLIRNIQNLE